jgi:hypothetical protein
MSKKVSASKPEETVISYKGFDKHWKCRDFQYAVGETYTHDGDVDACKSGFHACEYPLDIFNYYPPAGSNFAAVEQSGQLSRHGEDTNVASQTLTVSAEINFAGLVKAAIAYTISRCGPVDPESPASNTGDYSAASNTGYRSAASNTGYQSAASNTGDYSAASNTGYRSAASNTGDYSAASNTGYRSAASNTGYQSAASNTGDYSAASNTGYRSAASNTGDRSAASNTGYQSAASNTGYHSAASNTGDQSAASNTGDYSAASNTGDRSAASNTGRDSVAMASGYMGRAMAGESGAIILVYRNDNYELIHIRASKVGDNGIKAGAWYMLDAAGEFVESNN